ncbi:sigma factor-like helix-turn-helix DNA-binding protein, partial [Streptomyces sp. MCAF7]
CDIEGLSYEEIAATLGVKLGTVRSRIHRGRSHLRKALKHRSPEARAEQRTVTAVPHPATAPRLSGEVGIA